METLEVNDQVIDGVVVIGVSGSLDSTNAAMLKDLMDNHLVEGRSKFLLDYHSVEYISSAGWGILLGRLKKIRKRAGELIIAGMSQEIESIYRMLELNRVIPALPTLDEAAEHFGITIPLAKRKKIEQKRSPRDAIIEVMRKNPLVGFFRLRDLLTSPPYNFEYNILQFFLLLRKNGLETKLKRLYFLYQELIKERE
ncbi:MAG TPA: anti-sigma factor antagonist [bacterium (Candidatus Stahlbacteria)]|nr:anti-sigma factor antagonist [Candidatus Stahlbacteria bacterium]